MPKSVLNKNLESITKQEAEQYEAHLEERKPEKIQYWQKENWHDIEGGTEKIFTEVYQANTQYILQNRLYGKKDKASTAKILENIVIESMKNSRGADAIAAVEAFIAADKAGEFKTLDEKIGMLQRYALRYLGVNEESLGQLMARLESGEKNLILDGVKQFTDTLKLSVIRHYLNKKLLKLEVGNEHKLTAYAIDYIGRTYGIEPDSLGKELTKEPKEIMPQLDQLNMSKYENKSQATLAGYKPKVEYDKAA